MIATVCDACIEAMREEAAGSGIDDCDATIASLALDLGADIPDHMCDATDRLVERCDCACRRHRAPTPKTTGRGRARPKPATMTTKDGRSS